jgi:AcrR family transcriptional regulator
MPTRVRLAAAERRETILLAAVPLFGAAGYASTRVSDIAERVGVTEPVIFQNFGTKAELFAAVLERVAEEGAEQLDRMAGHAPDVLRLLGHLLSAEHLDWMHTHAVGTLFADARRLGEHHPVFPALQRCTARMVDAFAALLRLGQGDGSIRRDVPAPALAWLVMSLVQARELRRTQADATSARLEADLLHVTLALLRPR